MGISPLFLTTLSPFPLLGGTSDMAVTDIDVKDYVKFLLKKGSLEEKREIIGCVKSKVLLKNKQLTLEKIEEK